MNAVRKSTDLALIIAVATAWIPATYGQDAFPAGAESKLAGLESGHLARGATSLHYNPAQLAAPAEEPGLAIEIGYVNAALSYEHPEFDPVLIEVAAPIGTVGLQENFGFRRIMFGASLFPAKAGSLDIVGLPQRVGANVHALNVTSSDLLIHGAFGAAMRFEALTVGLSWIRSWETRRTYAALLTSSDRPLVEQTLNNDFDQAVMGIAHESRWFSASLSYTPPVVKRYGGFERIAGQGSETIPRSTDYIPARFSGGLGIKPWREWGLDLTVNRRDWAAGRGLMHAPGQPQDVASDVKSVTEWGIASQLPTTLRDLNLTGSYARLPSPWGEGTVEDGVYLLAGPPIGNVVSVDRQAAAVGLKYAATSGESLTTGVTQVWGRREFGEFSGNPGYVQILTTTLSMGGVWYF